jgi:hypothetical protein
MIRALLAILFISAIACSPKVIPLKGSYPETPIIQYSDNPVDTVWDHVIDFFAQKGLSIKIVDRSSGLIISDATSLSWTFENKKGFPNHPERQVVIPMVIAPGADKAVTPTSVIGEWNVRIKATGNRTSINVNLVNIRALVSTGSYMSGTASYTKVEDKSTGVFEKLIFNKIK